MTTLKDVATYHRQSFEIEDATGTHDSAKAALRMAELVKAAQALKLEVCLLQKMNPHIGEDGSPMRQQYNRACDALAALDKLEREP